MAVVYQKRKLIIGTITIVVAISIIAYYFIASKNSTKGFSVQTLKVLPPEETEVASGSGSPIKYINQNNYTGMKINEEYTFDLDGNGLKENFAIKSYEIVTDRKNDFTYYGLITDVLIKKTNKYVNLLPRIDGYLLDAKEVILNQRNKDIILLIELKQGALDNFLIYRYRNNNLIRVSTPDDILPQSYGILTRGVASFEDVDNDGVKEMVVYSRLSPPEKRRKVDVYKISGLEAKVIKTYEESTQNLY